MGSTSTSTTLAAHPQRGTGTYQPECADRAVRFDLDVRRLRIDARPGQLPNLVPRRARIVGFTGIDYPAREPEAFEALGRWQRSKLVQKEDIAVGLENTPRAFMRLFTGENFGKQLVKVADAAA